MASSLALSFVADLSSYLNEGQVVAFNIGPEGHAYVVIAQKPLDHRVTFPNGVTTGKTIPAQPQQYRVLAFDKHDGTVVLDVTIADCAFNVSDVQPVKDELLLAYSRSYYRGPNDFERNGYRFSRDGKPLGAILLGDGVSDVQATQSGVIWTGFFDEGIFGNFGWDAPIGASGLVAFDSTGKPLYTFAAPAGLDMICDCYALNVESDEATWCYYYTDFPLVCIRNYQVTDHWMMPVAGGHAFAVGGGYALFHGGYNDKSRYLLFTLPPRAKPKQIGSFEIDAPSTENKGQARGAQDRVIGRGDSLWLLRNGVHIYTVSIYDALARY